MLFDLDHFKTINDTYGQGTGDEVLRKFAKIAVSCIRSSDLIGRIGGEEFAAVVPGLGVEGAMAFAERVRTTFANAETIVESKPVAATVSAGVTVSASHEFVRGLEDLLERTDNALYAAKAAGRNRVSLYREPNLMEHDGSFLPALDPRHSA